MQRDDNVADSLFVSDYEPTLCSRSRSAKCSSFSLMCIASVCIRSLIVLESKEYGAESSKTKK